ncbi:MAG: hypothetical protein PVJ57_15340 [Phycisphaerae bacterium]|jgi:hypothetical protein
MRGATQCARRLRALFNTLRSKLGRVSPPASSDPITQMILGILSRDVPESKARSALDLLRGMVVDYNELRVIPPIELADMIGDYPDVRLKCEDVSRSLNRVFARNHVISLAHLTDQSARDVRAYLDSIDGLEDYTRARVRLLGLQQHAIYLDEAMWAYARQEEIVDKRCSLGEAQSFLERQISPEDALEFVALLGRQAWSEMGAAVRARDVTPIQSVPPDRTTRNMLQLVGAAASAAEEAPPPPAKPAPKAAKPAKPARKTKAASGEPAARPAATPARTKTPKAKAKSAAARPAAKSAKGKSTAKRQRGTTAAKPRSRAKSA